MTAIAGVTGTSNQPAPTALSALGSDGFLQLLVAQLRFQNPMEPTDTSAMMAQTSQLAQVEMLQQVAGLQREVVGLQEASVAAGLIGQRVTAMTADGSEIEGAVEAVRFSAGQAVLIVGDYEVPLGAAVQIGAASS